MYGKENEFISYFFEKKLPINNFVQSKQYFMQEVATLQTFISGMPNSGMNDS